MIPAAVVLPLLHIHVFLTARRVLHNRAKHTQHQPSASVVSLRSELSHHSHMDPVTGERDTMDSLVSVSHKMRRNLRPFKILAMMVVYFIVSWAPLAVWETVLFEGFTKPYLTPGEIFVTKAQVIGYYITVSLAVFNSVLNPLFYGVGNRMIWRSFVTMMTCRSSRRTRQNGHNMYNIVAHASQEPHSDKKLYACQ